MYRPRETRPLPKRAQVRPATVDRVVWERLWSACGRKVLYASQAQAEQAPSARTADLVPYLCPTGEHHWHLTKRTAPDA